MFIKRPVPTLETYVTMPTETFPHPLFAKRICVVGSASLPVAATLVLVSIAPHQSAAQTQGVKPLPANAASPTRRALPNADDDGFPPAWLTTLRALPYETTERGPLLAVIPAPLIEFPYDPAQPQPPTRFATLPALTTATNTKLFSAGGINVLAPRTITTINTKPGKANPFGDLNPSDTLKLLLSTFTPAQWQIAGSATGIGRGDLTDDQMVLWAQMLPEQARVQKSKVAAGDKPNSIRYTDTTMVDVHPASTGRLRLSKTVSFSFYKTGASDTSWGSDPYMGKSDQIGQTTWLLLNLQMRSQEKSNKTAYGVTLLSDQPRRLKNGAVDFAAPVLDKTISLRDFPPHNAKPTGGPGKTNAAAKPVAKTTPPSQPLTPQQRYAQLRQQAQAELAEEPTIGDLLERITKTTGVEFVADKRVRELPMYLRGESARAGDLLMALAVSVGGAFRRMEAGTAKDTAPLYVLTDDVEGIGARTARLGEWAEAADELKRRITDKADEAAAKNDPLAHLSFAPGDKYALSEAQTKRLEESWRKEQYGKTPDVLQADMSPALKKAVQDFADERATEGISIRTDRVQMGETLKPFLLLPEAEGQPLEAQELGNGVGHQYLQRVAFDPSKKPAPDPKAMKSVAPVPAPGFTSPALKKQRRVLIARPKTVDEATRIVQAAIGRGIEAVWLDVSLADAPASAQLLTKATAAGGKKIAVGAVVHLLKGSVGENGDDTLLGEPDRNIMGETGEAHRARVVSEYAGDKTYLSYYQNALNRFAGWNAIGPDVNGASAAELRRRVGVVAAVPHLAGLTFRATGGPGWTGEKDGGDALHINTAQGYTASMRRAFLRDYGIDPIDIPDLRWQLGGVRWNLGYFQPDDGRGEYEVIDKKLVRRSGDAIPLTAWWTYRRKRNAALLASVYASVRKERATLPLYIDDIVSSYASANTDWFGSWDTASGLPETSPFTVESETRTTARHTSKTIFAHWGWWWGEQDVAKPNAPTTFARQVSASALRNPPPSWDGLVIDLTGVPAASIPGLLEGLPKALTAP